MKKFVFIPLGLFLLFGCSQAVKDRGIKEMIASTAKEEVAFAGVNYTVSNGTVTLGGICPSEKEKNKVMEAVKNTAGVKGVVDQVVVAPVTLTADHPLQESVDSLLMEYPTVLGKVTDSVIALHGAVDGKKAQKLLSALQSLGAKAVTNGLVTNNETQ